MKKIMILCSVMLLTGTALLNSCTNSGKETDDRYHAAVSDTIQTLMGVVTRSANQLAADSVFRYLCDDSSSLYMSGGMHYSYKSLLSAFKSLYSGIKSQQISTVFSDVKVPCRDLAIWTGYMKSVIVSKSDEVREDYLCETWIWQRKSEGWKVIHYHESIMRMPPAAEKTMVEIALGKLAADLANKTLKTEEMNSLLTAILKASPLIYGSAFAFAPESADGKTKLSAPYVYRIPGGFKEIQLYNSFDYTLADWYAIPSKTGTPGWSKPYYDAEGGEVVMITYSVPVFSKDKVLKGVLTADLEIK